MNINIKFYAEMDPFPNYFDLFPCIGGSLAWDLPTFPPMNMIIFMFRFQKIGMFFIGLLFLVFLLLKIDIFPHIIS